MSGCPSTFIGDVRLVLVAVTLVVLLPPTVVENRCLRLHGDCAPSDLPLGSIEGGVVV